MKQPDVRKYLYDIAQACALIERFTEGKNLGDYTSDVMLRSAVERQFEIVGEALNQALSSDPSLGDCITDAPRIIAFRNRLIHGYASVANEVVWGVIERNLPTLASEVAELLGPR